MTSTTEIILKSDGTAVRRTSQEVELQISDTILKEFAGDTVRVIPKAGNIAGIPVSLIRSATETYACMSLPHLVLRTEWEMDTKTIMRPKFTNSGDAPVLPMEWPVPMDKGMVLLFVARIYSHTQSRPDKSCCLLAYNASHQSFLLPLPNLYGDGYVCMGKFDGQASSAIGAMELAFKQFLNSSWNMDLFDSDKRAKADRLFAFKSTGEDEFKPSPHPEPFAQCTRCENAITEIVRNLFK